MTIRDLIEQLEDLAQEHGDGTEVRLAHQPSWPLVFGVGDVAATEPVELGDKDEDGEAAGPNDVKAPIVYIGEGPALGYLDGDAAEALGWSERRR